MEEDHTSRLIGRWEDVDQKTAARMQQRSSARVSHSRQRVRYMRIAQRLLSVGSVVARFLLSIIQIPS